MDDVNQGNEILGRLQSLNGSLKHTLGHAASSKTKGIGLISYIIMVDYVLTYVLLNTLVFSLSIMYSMIQIQLSLYDS